MVTWLLDSIAMSWLLRGTIPSELSTSFDCTNFYWEDKIAVIFIASEYFFLESKISTPDPFLIHLCATK